MATNMSFSLAIDLTPFEELDGLALLASQSYNLGNSPDWFGSFRRGLYGMYTRLFTVRKHFYEVHNWGFVSQFPRDAEYHLSVTLFGMDSALECFTFALNALGYAIAPNEFLDVSKDRSLKRINPGNIIGGKPLPGYAIYFPSVQDLWVSNLDLIQTIVDQHDVSKHRTIIFSGGQVRADPPAGFYEALGISEDDPRRIMVSPMAEILLIPNPKSAAATQRSATLEKPVNFESVGKDFASLLKATGKGVLQDARTNIHLKVKSLRA